MSKLPDNHVAVSALTGTKVPCRLLTKTRIFDAHKNCQKRGAGAGKKTRIFDAYEIVIFKKT